MRPFSQVDVFTTEPLGGNPVAVVHDAEGIDEARMRRFAHWTNLSETTFLLPPTTDEADYRLRIFTPGAELPFAGHPTIGSAHAWLEAGGVPRSDGELVQECGAGLVRLRRTDRLAFAAPPLLRSGPVSGEDLDRVCRALAVQGGDVVDAAWVDNGPGWVGILLADADAVLALEPDWGTFGDLDVGVIGAYREEQAAEVGAAVEVRAFCPGLGVVEDPVTGSLNAGLAQWLTGNGTLPASYVASQGTRLGRTGRVHVERDGDTIWVGGDATTVVAGQVAF
ncbi:MAG: PhzF family phenazine biosynthesis protein [Nocardioidaceae bacterium]